MSHSVRLNSPIPDELADEFLKKLPYVSEALASFELNPLSRDTVAFELKAGNGDLRQLVAERIVEVADKLCKGRRPHVAKVLHSKRERDFRFRSDPHQALEQMGELHKYGAGRFGLGPRVLELMELFDHDVQEMGARASAVPFQFPSLIGADVLDRCRYLRSFPSALTMVSHLREDLTAIQDFARVAAWDGERLVHSPGALSAIQCLLAPSVCFHLYAWLAKQRLETKCVTAVGKCFRYESSNMAGLERLWDFTMREVIFVGPDRYVLDSRQKMADETARLMDRWGLAYEIRSATDPFFIEDYASMSTFQLAFELKFEVLTPLPYSNKDLAIGSLNYHQDFFGRSFEISGTSGAAIHTGCIGFGLERVALAFLAQNGLDPKAWPQEIASRLKRW
jgi:hypothetical protein